MHLFKSDSYIVEAKQWIVCPSVRSLGRERWEKGFVYSREVEGDRDACVQISIADMYELLANGLV